jgi:radical SAM superfamily enzyme YgiQ (UPF0313 family)
MPKLLLINPVNPVNIFSFLKPNFSRTNGVVFVPPIGLGYIAAVTPKSWQVKLLDEAVDPFVFEPADLVGITATTGQAPRAYEIADIYRKRGIPVVMGGIHVSFRPDEALRHADSIVTGEAENIWPKVMEDFSGNELRAFQQKIQNRICHDLARLPFCLRFLHRYDLQRFAPAAQTDSSRHRGIEDSSAKVRVLSRR